MKREDVKAIFAEATDEQLNKIMGLHGADVEKYKGKVTALETENTEKKKTAFDNLNAEFEKLKASNTSAEDYKAKFEQNEFAQQLVRHWVKETAGTLVNLSRTKALCFEKTDAFGNVVGSVPLKGAYEQAIAEAVTAVTSGTTEFNTAMARTVERLGGSGVKVTYGSGVNRSLSAMIRQNLLYSAKQAAQSYDEYIGKN